jgi:hypothetical protein
MDGSRENYTFTFYHIEGGSQLTGTQLFTNTAFVLLLFIKVAVVMFCRPITLCLLKCIIENIRVAEGRKYFPQGPTCGPLVAKRGLLLVEATDRSASTHRLKM